METILVTGAAGFIGYHLAERLLREGHRVIGVDNLNDYYDVSLKTARLDRLRPDPQFQFIKTDLSDRQSTENLFAEHQFTQVVHLAAQAGVRYSIENPHVYVDSNIKGFLHILEGCRHQKVQHLVYASSSSVYGANKKLPFSVTDSVDHPISLYAATKKSNELMAHTYSHLFHIPVTGLRFFTVYGPWGRPDMALFKFTQSILQGDPIDVYHQGKMRRDFTYIDDIIEGVFRVMKRPPRVQNETAPYRLFNIGNSQPVELMDFIEAVEKATGKTAKKNFLPLQPGDVVETFADVQELEETIEFRPQTSVTDGVQNFVNWYRDYYRSTL